MPTTWHSLNTEAEKVASTTAQQAADTCSLLDKSISILADGFIEAEIKDTGSAYAQAGLLSQNLNSLKCSVDLAMRGYYTQSTGLLRGVYENWVAFHYLEEYPTKSDYWLQKNKRPPGHSDMLKALGPSFREKKADARGWYGALCRFAHTDTLVVLPHLGYYNGEPCAFIGATYKADLFNVCSYTISLFTSIMLREISILIPPDSAWQKRYKTAIEALLRFIEKENDELKKSSRWEIVTIIKYKFSETSNPAEIPKLRGGNSFSAELSIEGIYVDNLGSQPFLPWAVFNEAIKILNQNKGTAKRGDAMNSKLGDQRLPLNSIEGHIAHVVYGKQIGESVFRRITPIACILIWAGVCQAIPGGLTLIR